MLLLDSAPDVPEPPEAAAVVMLPSGLRFTVTVQACPAALVPCFVIASAWAVACVRLPPATVPTSTNNVVAFMARLLGWARAAEGPPA